MPRTFTRKQNLILPDSAKLIDRTNRVWSLDPLPQKTDIRSDIPPSGLTEYGLNFETEIGAFMLLLTDTILEVIVKATNERGSRQAALHNAAYEALNLISEQDKSSFLSWFATFKVIIGKPLRNLVERNEMPDAVEIKVLKSRLFLRKSFRKIDQIELLSFIGFHILCGVRHCQRTPLNRLFTASSMLCFDDAANAISLSRTKELYRILSFATDARQEEIRQNNDMGLGKIIDIYEELRKNFQKAYNPQQNLVVDEQLIKYRGRFKAKQYMPKKPDKIGIKQWLLVDSSLYIYNMQIYMGSEGLRINGREKGQARRVVFDMVDPLNGYYELTTDRYFTKLDTALELLSNKNITLLGTIRIDNKNLPLALTEKQQRSSGSSIYAFSSEVTLISYCPKPNKLVPLLSTRHPCENGTPANATAADIRESGRPDVKPRMILDYNKTKGFVDVIDKMAKEYTCYRGTRKWHLAIFYRLIDLTAINAHISYNMKRRREGKSQISRLDFLMNLAKSLIRDHALRRAEDKRLPLYRRISIKRRYQEVNEENIDTPCIVGKSSNRKRCKICPKGSNNKTPYYCKHCKDYICRRHATIYYAAECMRCTESNNNSSDNE